MLEPGSDKIAVPHRVVSYGEYGCCKCVQLKEEQEEAAQVAKGAKLRQESQRGKLGGKKLQQKASASMLDKACA